MRPSTNPTNTIKALIYSTFSGSKYTNYGKDHEPNVRKDFDKIIQKNVIQCEFFVGKGDYCYLGALRASSVETNCPYTARDSTPEDVILKSRIL